jgi:hypothetical protein
MTETSIREGLNRNGNLAWVLLAMAEANGKLATGTLYLLPTSDFNKLIKPLIPREMKIVKEGKIVQPVPPSKPKVDVGGLRAVNIAGQEGFVAKLGSSAIFSFATDENALKESIDLGPTFYAARRQ